MNARAGRLAILFTCFLVVVTVTAGARTASAAGGPFGLGLIIGSPTGLSGKYYFNQRNALDFAIGAAFLDRRGLQVHVDYLWHPVMLAQEESFFMPLYLGIGARVLDHDRGHDDNDTHFGARVPLGILFDFKRVPIDVFLEIALVVDLISDHDNRIDLNAGVGFRYYF